MKKFAALLLVVLVAVSLSACRAFHDDRVKTYAQDDPYEATIFLQVTHLPDGTTVDDEFRQWLGDIRILIETMKTEPDETAVKITDIKHRDTATDGTLVVDLTLTNVPADTLHTVVRPFKIDYTQTIYNPIALLPESTTFTYFVGITSQRRHSAANTDLIVAQTDGTYAYLWMTADALEICDTYPNRPLYYALVIAGAALLGIIVYVIARLRQPKLQPDQPLA